MGHSIHRLEKEAHVTMQTPDRETERTNPQRQRPAKAPHVRKDAPRPAATPVASPGSGRASSHTESQEPVVFARHGDASAARPGKPKSFWVAVGIAVLALVVAAVLAFALLSNAGAGRDPNAAVGQLEGKTQEEIQAELDRIVEEGMFNISIASSVQLEDGASEAELRIENVPNNPYLMKVEIVRDDTGETVYTSGMVEPNHHIQSATFDVDLDAGEYPCTAVFYAYGKDDEQLVGQAAAKLTVTVLN